MMKFYIWRWERRANSCQKLHEFVTNFWSYGKIIKITTEKRSEKFIGIVFWRVLLTCLTFYHSHSIFVFISIHCWTYNEQQDEQKNISMYFPYFPSFFFRFPKLNFPQKENFVDLQWKLSEIMEVKSLNNDT